jgi:HAD superfamily hydrolase (TIGR01509 family)
MLRAVLFDFNGVLVDDEPLHCRLLREILAGEGIAVSEEEYYRRYLPMDAVDCFRVALIDHGQEPERERVAALVRRKLAAYEELEGTIELFPGARRIVQETAAQYPLGIVSGAFREEIERILSRHRLLDFFEIVVSAQEGGRGKPAPDGYLHAVDRLNEVLAPREPFQAEECLAVEDSMGGISAAHAAGMKCLAVASSYAPEDLGAADSVTLSLEDMTVARVERIFEVRSPR